MLTTAGCAHQKPTSIGYGSDELKRIFERVRRPVSRIVLQPIEPDHALQQLALLELGEPLYFNESVQPACLMSTDTLDRSLHDWPLSSSGWGRKAGVTLMRLQQEQIRVVTEFATNLKTIKMRMNRTLSDRCSNENLICTEPISQSGWLNEGDIGNPLYLTVESLYYVFGLAVDFEFIYANFRTSMAQQFSANLFIDLRRQMTFIQEYISPQELCIHHPPFS